MGIQEEGLGRLQWQREKKPHGKPRQNARRPRSRRPHAERLRPPEKPGQSAKSQGRRRRFAHRHLKKASPPAAKPTSIRPTPTPPAQPATSEERIGVVTHYYSHVSVATIQLERGTLRVGDVIHISGHTTDFRQRVESLEVDHAPTTE